MKHTSPPYSTTALAIPGAKRKSLYNGSAGKRYHSGRSAKSTFDGKRVSKKVHSNINFTKLDEVCLDVGKVDLSYSARLRNDTGLSPPKGYRDLNGEIRESIRSCYVQLESLEQQQKSSLGTSPQVSSTVFCGTEDEEWKGWPSSISFSQQYGCPLVRVKECSKVSSVLVMSEDLVDSECKILEKRNGCKLNRNNFETSVLGTSVKDDGKKSHEAKNGELKEKLRQFFDDTRELHNFFECIDFSLSQRQFETPQNKSCNRKLDFNVGDNDVPSSSNRDVECDARERSKANVHSSGRSCGEETGKFLGYNDRAIFSSTKYARSFLDYYDKVEKQTGIFI